MRRDIDDDLGARSCMSRNPERYIRPKMPPVGSRGTLLNGLAAAALVLLSSAGCATGHARPLTVNAPPKTGSVTTVPPSTVAPTAGDYASLPANPNGPLSNAQAVAAARHWGIAPQALSAPAAAFDMTYSAFLQKTGRSGRQLASTDPVILVMVDSPLSTQRFPMPPNAKAQVWPNYSVAFDVRTWHELWIGPQIP